MSAMELGPVERITAGAVGEPGHRTFFLQARVRGRLLTFLVEKEQVELLAASILDILARVGRETGSGPGEEELELEAPLEPEWRVGRLAIGYAEDRDLMMLELEELREEEPEGGARVEALDERPEIPRVRSRPASGCGRRASRCWPSPVTGRPWRRGAARDACSATTRWTRRDTRVRR